MPAIVPVILAAVQAGIAIAPDVLKAAAAAKAFITSLTGTTITVADQNFMHANVDAQSAAILAGLPPPAWQVQP